MIKVLSRYNQRQLIIKLLKKEYGSSVPGGARGADAPFPNANCPFFNVECPFLSIILF